MRAVLLAATLALLQGTILPDGLLPPAPAAPPADAAVLRGLEEFAAQESWDWSEIESWRAQGAERADALAVAVSGADDRALRLYATLAAGCNGDSPLAHALLRRAAQGLPEAAAVACLLAPERVPEEWWGALAHLAARTAAPLDVRGAALARLLDSGCDAAWPWARALLATGTARDEGSDPFADWRRAGRYELPKRLLAGALDARAVRLGLEPPAFEPNAAWTDQERAIERIARTFGTAGASTQPPPCWRALLRPAAAGEPAARRALALLGAERPALLRTALGSADPAIAAAARRALDERPR